MAWCYSARTSCDRKSECGLQMVSFQLLVMAGKGSRNVLTLFPCSWEWVRLFPTCFVCIRWICMCFILKCIQSLCCKLATWWNSAVSLFHYACLANILTLQDVGRACRVELNVQGLHKKRLCVSSFVCMCAHTRSCETHWEPKHVVVTL